MITTLLLLPFVLLVLSIAIWPIASHAGWERFRPYVCATLGLVPVAYYLFVKREYIEVLHILHEYLSFICLVGSLFVIAGGIHLVVHRQAGPGRNVLILLFGGLLANVLGTTGASMLLIRPYLQLNRVRLTSYHPIFFIFIVSNIGGCLTPIGDPPLLLGYLKGVPFEWVFQNCWSAWLVAVGLLLALFWVIDQRNYLRLPESVRAEISENRAGGLQVQGLWPNLLCLAVALGAIFFPEPTGLREILQVSAAVVSYFCTSEQVHRANHFTFHPVREVAWVFAGLFATMLPAIDYLSENASKFGLSTPQQYYWFTGALSAVLDNAPTYLAFLATALGSDGLLLEHPGSIDTFLTLGRGPILQAISLGAVFFGAMTYLGNAPNFMVKSIVEGSGKRLPSLWGYFFRFSLPILLPILWIVSVIVF